MATLSLPPTRSKSSKPISTAHALSLLQTYLSAAENPSNAHLLPNATLQQDGPKAQSEAGANLVIHNLKRVEAGLRGEWLAPVLDLQGVDAEDPFGVTSIGFANGGTAGGVNGNGGGEEQMEGWQDLEEYQREQSVEEGEVGPRDTGIAQEGDEVMDLDVGIEVNGNANAAKVVDKEARKRAKKERAKKEKQLKHMKQQNAKK